MNILDHISYHAVYDSSIMDALEYAQGNGFAGVQLAVEVPHLSFERTSLPERQEIRDFVSDHNINISLHAPDDISFFEPSRYLRQGILNYCKALFNFAEEIGAKIVTFHPGSMATFPTDTTIEERTPQADLFLYRNMFQESLNEVVRIAKNRTTICIENYRLDDLSMGLLQPYLDNDKFFLCWDIAKTYDSKITKINDVEKYYINNIKRIKQVHVHDINSHGRSHRVIGTGIIDFRYFLSLLANADVLDYCIEVRPREKAKESLENLIKIWR